MTVTPTVEVISTPFVISGLTEGNSLPVPGSDANAEAAAAPTVVTVIPLAEVTATPNVEVASTPTVEIDAQAFEKLREKTLRSLGPPGSPGSIAERLSPRLLVMARVNLFMN